MDKCGPQGKVRSIVMLHPPAWPRRRFLQSGAVALPALAAAWNAPAAPSPQPASFAFPLLGDLHFDRLDHHDMAWLEREKPNDVWQVQNYSRLTGESLPRLFAAVARATRRLNESPPTRVPFVLHVGDFVEGLCGTPELAARQNREAVAFVDEAALGAPFLFTKGNHDVTGPGAVEAYRDVFHPFLTGQLRRLGPQTEPVRAGHYAFEQGGALFACFDAYDAEASLEWLEALLGRRTARHLFVVVHPPVVPYGARTTWHLFSSTKQQARREHLLGLLGRHGAFVLSGHLHKFNCLVRQTPRGRFLQLAVSSIVSRPDPQPKDLLDGADAYTPDQIQVEPSYGAGTEAERRAVIEAERPFVKAFQYADLPGHAVVRVTPEEVTVEVFGGHGDVPWRTVSLSRMLAG
jgi:hypothetical protein